jgi:hypothetical protein
MKPETHQSLKQSAIILGLVFAGLIIMWILVAGLGLWISSKWKRPPTEAASYNERAVASAPQQKDYDNDHQYRADASAIIMVGGPQIEPAAAKKEN